MRPNSGKPPSRDSFERKRQQRKKKPGKRRERPGGQPDHPVKQVFDKDVTDRSFTEESSADGAGRTEVLPTRERCEFVRKRVEAYQNEMLSYEIGLERHRRNASREALMNALALGEELPKVESIPVLSLNSDEWVWDRQELRKAVCDSLKELKVPVPEDVNEPAAQAARACDRWAAAEAKRRFDRTMDLDTPATPAAPNP